MKRQLLVYSLFFLFLIKINAQVGIGTSTPNPSSQLDVVSNNKGILVPRISLTGTIDATTISNGNINSLLVFNTQTVADVTPGYYYWYVNKWIRLGSSEIITNLVDNGNGTITYTNESDIKETIDIAKIARAYETLTSATFDPTTGVLTYNDEAGTANTLNLSTMIPNFETLTSISQDPTAGTITYVDEKGASTVLNILTLIKQNETLTSATFNPTTGVLTYNDEAGTANTLNLSTMIPNFETLTSISQNLTAGTITYVDEKGASTVLNILTLIKQNETLTSATFDATTGVLTYNDEAGTANTLNLSTMIPNFETLTSISQDPTAGTITYVDEKGVSTVLDILTLIKQNETLTSATFDATTGVLTYNDEAGTANTLNLSTMIPNFETLTLISQDVTAGTITYTDEAGTPNVLNIAALIAQHETLTSATFDAATGILTYNDEAGTANTLNLSTMIPNFETLTSISQDVTAGTITYVDEAGTPNVLNIATLIAQHETVTTLGLTTGILSYSNENATNLPINLVSADANNAIAAGTDGALFADKATLAIEPWFVQGTTNKATLNTENIYQMGRVGINKQTADKQLDVQGDFRSVSPASNGKFHSIEVNSMELGRPSTHMFVGNGSTPATSLDMSIIAVENGSATIYSKGTTSQSATILTAYNQGVHFIFDTPTNSVEGSYIFPRNNGLPNQILMTNGNPNTAQLQWIDYQSILNINPHNGLQGSGLDVVLGGPLDSATTITTDTVNTLAIAGLQPSTTNTDKLVVTDVNGVLKNTSGAMPRFFYMPAITFDTTTPLAGQTVNLYQEYVNQFSNVTVRSAGAPAAIPFLPAATDLYYYVTYFDPAVFANLSVDANGVLTYDIIGTGTPSSYLNIVFVIK